jgi:hypothetical protein
MTTEPTTVADEIAAMRKLAAVLDKLDTAAQERVVTWMAGRYPVQTQEPS